MVAFAAFSRRIAPTSYHGTLLSGSTVTRSEPLPSFFMLGSAASFVWYIGIQPSEESAELPRTSGTEGTLTGMSPTDSM